MKHIKRWYALYLQRRADRLAIELYLDDCQMNPAQYDRYVRLARRYTSARDAAIHARKWL